MSDGPRPLGDLLRDLARTFRRADLGQVDQLRAIWRDHADAELADTCVPQGIESGSLVVSVPSGAHAERVRRQSAAILQWYAELGEGAPTRVVTRVRPQP